MNQPLALDDLAVECCIPCQRVRQIEARAIQKVRRTAQIAGARRGKSPKTLPAERAKHTLNELAQEASPRNDYYMAAGARGDAIRDAKPARTPAFARSVTQQLHNLKESPP
jgi:hypothetical protein